MTPFLQSAEHRADMAALHRRLAGQRKREMERFWAELPSREDHMAMIVADEESRLAAEAAREARYQPTGFVGWHDGKDKTLALFSDDPDMPQHIAGGIAYGD